MSIASCGVCFVRTALEGAAARLLLHVSLLGSDFRGANSDRTPVLCSCHFILFAGGLSSMSGGHGDGMRRSAAGSTNSAQHHRRPSKDHGMEAITQQAALASKAQRWGVCVQVWAERGLPCHVTPALQNCMRPASQLLLHNCADGDTCRCWMGLSILE